MTFEQAATMRWKRRINKREYRSYRYSLLRFVKQPAFCHYWQ